VRWPNQAVAALNPVLILNLNCKTNKIITISTFYLKETEKYHIQ